MTHEEPDPERSQGVAERVDARHYGDPAGERPAHVASLQVEEVLGRTGDGGSCSLCGSDYRGAPYSDGRGVRVLAAVEPGVVEPVNLCPECFDGLPCVSFGADGLDVEDGGQV